MSAENRGKTLWEMLCERLRGEDKGGIEFENPLDLRVGSPVVIAHANGPEFADYSFTVLEIREYHRTLGGQSFRFTDYVLNGTNTKSFAVAERLTLRLRVVPNPAGGQDALLLRLYDEFAFAEDFLAVLKDPTGIFEVKDEGSGSAATFSRINDVRGSWQAAVLRIAETTSDGKGAPGKTSGLQTEYWDYWRDVEIGAGKTAKEFLFAEMNCDNGWFALWRGREFFPGAG